MNRAAPWYVWCAVLAVTSAMVGVHWDISWHRSIGRDTFFTPAHLAIYLCGVLAGISCGYLILATTFGRQPGLRAASVRIWGFRGPLGAFIAAWGGIAMLTSAPFDDWWHNTYGLDVKILSPPHTVLALGLFSVEIGALLLVLGRMNREPAGPGRRLLEWIYVYLSGMVLVNAATMTMEFQSRVYMHSALYYRVAAMTFPMFLVAVTRPLPGKWKTTKAAAVYTAFWCVMNWVLPLFPAEPKLGPVYNQVTHFIPSFFPMLLLAPAVVLDLFLARSESWPGWRRGFAAGALFLAVLVAVQWPFGDFLMSKWARNWFFFTHMLDYSTPPTSYTARHLFYPFEQTLTRFWGSLGIGLAVSMLGCWLGLAWGRWLSEVKR